MIQGHTHYFAETLFSDECGTERRCECGARLWEPDTNEPVLKFLNGNIFKRGGRLVFVKHATHTSGQQGTED
jgi:hypothetical protein